MAALTVTARTATVRLRFRLGELGLFTAGLSLRIPETHFTQLASDPRVTAAALLANGATPPWDGILLRSHPVEKPLPRLAWDSRHLRYVPSHYQRYFVDLQGTMEGYLAKFSAKTRSTLRRKLRKFEEHCGGEIPWRQFDDAAGMEEFVRLARQVSVKTYQETLLDAGLPADEEFRHRIIDEAAHGRARGYILSCADRPVAYLFCPILDGGILIYQYLGYDPDFAAWSPGTVLQLVVLESLFDEGRFQMFDFTEGEGTHKQLFATGSRLCADVYYLRPTPRNIVLALLHLTLDRVSTGAGRFLEWVGLKRALKRLLRRWRAPREVEAGRGPTPSARREDAGAAGEPDS